MRLRKGILIISVAALLLLLCVAAIEDKKLSEQPIESMIAADPASQSNIFIIGQIDHEEPPLPFETTNPSELTLPEEIAADAPLAKQYTEAQASVRESVPTDGFLLRIRGSKISVGFETTEEALEKRPGWLNTSAYPGEEGVCIIYGHRNRKHLRALEKAEIGDEITISTADENAFTYTIYDIYIVDDLAEILITSTNEPSLVLVTCYPFRYSGSAPQKYVAIAKLI